MSVGKDACVHVLHGREKVCTVSGGSDDFVLETEGGLVDEPADDAELDVFHGQLLREGYVHAVHGLELLDQRHYFSVELLLSALLSVLGIQVEPLPGLASQPALLHHLGHHSRIASSHSRPQISFRHEQAHMVRNIDADLVYETSTASYHTSRHTSKCCCYCFMEASDRTNLTR